MDLPPISYLDNNQDQFPVIHKVYWVNHARSERTQYLRAFSNLPGQPVDFRLSEQNHVLKTKTLPVSKKQVNFNVTSRACLTVCRGTALHRTTAVTIWVQCDWLVMPQGVLNMIWWVDNLHMRFRPI
jgi:hypothetical protein